MKNLSTNQIHQHHAKACATLPQGVYSQNTARMLQQCSFSDDFQLVDEYILQHASLEKSDKTVNSCELILISYAQKNFVSNHDSHKIRKKIRLADKVTFV